MESKHRKFYKDMIYENPSKAISNIRKVLKRYVEKSKLQSLVIGISGGIDSCLCAALAKPVCDELGIPLIGRSLPMSTNASDEIERAKLTGKVFCTDFKEVKSLGGLYFQIDEKLNGYEDSIESKIRQGNIKARLRMIYLYFSLCIFF